MCASMKCGMLMNGLLNSRAQCLSIVCVRHYPRWTHRSPIGIVENEISREEKERWKLKVEREVLEHRDECNRKVLNVNTDRKYRNQSFSVTSQVIQSRHEDVDSQLPLSKNVGKNSAEWSYSSTETASASHMETHFQDNFMLNKASETENTDESLWTRRNYLKGSSFENEKETVVQKPKLLVKRKIYDAKEFEKAIKFRNSAAKLGVPLFTDLGDNDTILSQYMTNVKSKKKREKARQILLEGKRLIGDCLQAGLVPEAVFFSRLNDLKALNLPQEGVKIYRIFYKKICVWSDVMTPQGVLAILKTPDVTVKKPYSLPLTVICDNIRDPGNLGAILRTCAGVGCEKVILTKGCTDLWDPKVIRSAAGSHFRLSIDEVDNWKEIENRMNPDSCVFIAENNTASVEHSLKTKAIGEDELNSESENDSDDDDVKSQIPTTLGQDSELTLLPLVPYYGFNYSTTLSVVLIVGGETEGVSHEAYKFASQVSGVRLHIPLSNGVESLNSGTALGVIAFEMKKQFLMKPSEPRHEENIIADDPRTVVRNT